MYKTDFKIKTITRDKEGHYIMIKEDITIANSSIPDIVAPQYIRQILTDIKEEIDINGTPPQYSCLENPMGGGAW